MAKLSRLERISAKCTIMAAGLLLAFIAGVRFGSNAAPAPSAEDHPAAPVAANEAATVPDTGMDSASAHLIQALVALVRAQGALGKAAVKNHGGFVEQGRVDVNRAYMDANAALNYLQQHPEADAFPAEKMDDALVHPAVIPDYSIKADGSNDSPNLANAINALNEALAALTGKDGKHLIPVPMDGIRDRIIEGISATATDVLSAYEFGIGHNPWQPATGPKGSPGR